MEIKAKFWIENNGEVVLGGGKAELLLTVDRLGSIQRAAEEFGMSYRHAWGAIRKIEQRAGFKILDKKLGGKDRGAQLTEKGKKFIVEVDSFLKELQAIVKKRFRQKFQRYHMKGKIKEEFGMIKVSEKYASPELLLESLKIDSSGSIVMHLGIVRPHSNGRRVVSIEYEMDKRAAEKELSNIAKEIMTKWKIQDIALYRRKGRLNIGDVILMAAIAAPHRREAFEACEYAVECMRRMKSIKKKEIFE
jgi:molybdopterin synthase catalytic subunit